ncbi:hypothetical protein P4244_01015 [Bacillus thuringiensis]|nr:hypothetical protein [Bacillus thuringiensis]
MNNIFLKPLKTIFLAIGIVVLGVFADVATLIQFNIVDWFKEHLPWSLVSSLFIFVALYIGLVFYYYFSASKDDSKKGIEATKSVTQSIDTKKIEGSTIKMAGRDLNENHRES